MTHPFETAGLGKAPFRFVGMIEQDLCYGEAILNREEYQRTGIRIVTEPGGSCDYCGNYIVQMYRIRSSDGRTFKVGCDCVEKVTEKSDPGLASAVRRARLDRARMARAAKDAATKRQLQGLLPSMLDTLRAMPHPNKYRAAAGDTAADYAEFMMRASGAAGRAKLLKWLLAAKP